MPIVGMTERQLRQMLIIEGELLTICSIVLSAVLSVIAGPFVSNILNGMSWFFTYRFTMLPLVVITPFFVLTGFLLPLITYRLTSGKSVVERLREAE